MTRVLAPGTYPLKCIAAPPMWLQRVDNRGRAVRHAPNYIARRAGGTAVVIEVRPDARDRDGDAAVFAATARATASVAVQAHGLRPTTEAPDGRPSWCRRGASA